MTNELMERPQRSGVWERLMFNRPDWSQSIRLVPEIFVEDSAGVEIPPTPGCTLTVVDERGHSASIRLDGRMLRDIVDFLAACSKE